MLAPSGAVFFVQHLSVHVYQVLDDKKSPEVSQPRGSCVLGYPREMDSPTCAIL